MEVAPPTHRPSHSGSDCNTQWVAIASPDGSDGKWERWLTWCIAVPSMLSALSPLATFLLPPRQFIQPPPGGLVMNAAAGMEGFPKARH